jgi:hypothetical protein
LPAPPRTFSTPIARSIARIAGTAARAKVKKNSELARGRAIAGPIIAAAAIQRVIAKPAIKHIGKAIAQDAVIAIAASVLLGQRGERQTRSSPAPAARAICGESRASAITTPSPAPPSRRRERHPACPSPLTAIKHIGKAIAQYAVIAIATEDVFNLLQVVLPNGPEMMCPRRD